MSRRVSHSTPVQRPLAHRCVMLSLQVTAYYGLIRDCPVLQCLIFFVHWFFALRPRLGWSRQVPQFAPRICNTMPPSVPRRLHRMHMVVSSPMIIAFAIFVLAQQPLPTYAGSHAGWVTRLQSSLYATAWCLASPTPARAFTIKLPPNGSPQSDVDYNYTAYNQLPQPDFHRQDTRPYGLRTETTETPKNPLGPCGENAALKRRRN